MSQTQVRYYSAHIKSQVLAGNAQRTTEQVRADNEHAAKLRAQDTILVQGPVEEGGTIKVPSWRWNPELVAAVKAWSGRFEKELPYTLSIVVNGQSYTPTVTMSTWFIPAAPGRLDAIRVLYERVFCRELAMARVAGQLAPLGRF